MFSKIIEKDKFIDVVINNAGGGPMVPAEKAPPKLSESIIKLNLYFIIIIYFLVGISKS